MRRFAFKSKFFTDSLYRIVANGVVVSVQQLLVYPGLARIFPEDQFGFILVCYGLFYTITTSLGNSLNNVRQVTISEYKKQNVSGDFKVFLFSAAILGMLAMSIFLTITPNNSFLSQLLIVITTFISVINAYLVVHFFIRMDFRSSLVNSVLTALGFIIGIVLSKFTQIWSLSLFLGSAFALIHLSVTTPLLKETVKKTYLFKGTRNTYFAFSATSLLANAVIYLDRFFLFPLLGAASVSVYSAASFFGKTAAIIITPISTVLLSHISQEDYCMTKKKYFKITLGAVFVGLITILFSVILSRPIVRLLYPTLADEAMTILFLANLAAIIATSANLINPVVLRYSKKINLVAIQISYAILYIVIGIFLSRNHGLVGFCVASIIVNALKMAAFVATGYKSIPT